MTAQRISVAQSFSRTPGGRYRSDGPYSGQAFREDVLVPLLKSETEKVVIDLSGVLALGSSFLEEAFGGLVRNSNYKADVLLDRLVIQSPVSMYESRIWDYIRSAKKSS